MPQQRVLITGANGLLGSALAPAFQRRGSAEVLRLGRGELDITDAEAVRSRMDSFHPDVVINCAAYTRVDDCETHEPLALQVNGRGAGNVARSAAAVGARVIHLSTDYVFDGRAREPYPEDHATGEPARLSAYGRSKRLGEQLVREASPDAVIVRSSWLFGPAGRCFPQAILDRARRGEPLAVVDDQVGAPTYAPDLAEAIADLAERRARGIFHVTNTGACSWYAFACAILRHAGLDVPIRPVGSEAVPRPARRPAYSVLDNRRFVETVGRPLRPWLDALDAYLSSAGRP